MGRDPQLQGGDGPLMCVRCGTKPDQKYGRDRLRRGTQRRREIVNPFLLRSLAHAAPLPPLPPILVSSLPPPRPSSLVLGDRGIVRSRKLGPVWSRGGRGRRGPAVARDGSDGRVHPDRALRSVMSCFHGAGAKAKGAKPRHAARFSVGLFEIGTLEDSGSKGGPVLQGFTGEKWLGRLGRR